MSNDLLVWGVIAVAIVLVAGVVWLVGWLDDRMNNDTEDK